MEKYYEQMQMSVLTRRSLKIEEIDGARCTVNRVCACSHWSVSVPIAQMVVCVNPVNVFYYNSICCKCILLQFYLMYTAIILYLESIVAIIA